ncbi:hypothetical protein ACFVUW_11060 [Streptomyces xiamenensis]|uniref:hypothetical protein n=1 Tax=Streptomyces xiamenensis TaxID=408015 RepID=UPI0036F0CFBC
MEPALYQVLPPAADRVYMELDPDDVETLVVSVHEDVMGALTRFPNEVAALLWVALEQAGQDREVELELRNLLLLILLVPMHLVSGAEVMEAVDRLTARGFLERTGPRGVLLNPEAVRIIERKELPARTRLEWNAAKAACPQSVPG